MTPVDRAWLAGLLEGEGSFTTTRPQEVRISLEMTDEDVVARAATLMGTHYIPKPPRRDQPSHWKPQYKACLSGRRAIDLMKELLPYMGERRSLRIGEITGDWFEARMFVCQTCSADFFRERKGGQPPTSCSPTCQKTYSQKYMAAWKAQRKAVA